MGQIKLKITANIEPFNQQLKAGENPILIAQNSVLTVQDDDPFFQRYLALGWAVEESKDEAEIEEEEDQE